MELKQSGKNHSNSATVSVGGMADFQGVPEGAYLLTVRTSRGETLHQEMVTVRSHGGPVSIRLPEHKVERPVQGVISVARLRHKIPKQAKKAFDKSVDLREKGDIEGSLEQLKRATELDSEYMEAFNNLGARYLQLGQSEKALAAFQRALELDPSAALVQTNIGAALMAMGQMKEAEATFRRVLENSGGQVKARYLLGLALYAQRQYTEETLDLLRRSEIDYPSARLAMAAVHANMGHTKQAEQVLYSYLSNGPEQGREQARAMLARLQQNEK
jgi:tetratricopeptide (TPR) repeat protein